LFRNFLCVPQLFYLQFERDESFVQLIEKNTLRFVEIFCKVIDTLIPEVDVPIELQDTVDILWNIRQERERKRLGEQVMLFYRVDPKSKRNFQRQQFGVVNPTPADPNAPKEAQINFPEELKRR
jgi:hypothetical protein